MQAALPTDDFTLPAQPHRPGSGSQPDRSLLSAAKAACPKITDPERWGENHSYRAGWSLFDAGFYWEAHEVWEAVWLACRPNSIEQRFLKMMIQAANARLKETMGKDKAARRLDDEVALLLVEVQAALGDKVEAFMGVDLKALEHWQVK